MSEPITIRCRHCLRETTIEKRETDERVARRRWFFVVTEWDDWYDTSYHVVCGGNDQRLFTELSDGHMKEVDSCVGKEEQQRSSSHLVLPFAGPSPRCPNNGGSIRGIAHGKRMYHLFLPDMGEPPKDIEKSHGASR